MIVIWASTEGLTSVASKPILKIADAQMAFARMPCKKESPAVGRTHNQCLSRTSSYQSIESYCPLISQVVLCGMSIEL